MSTRKSKRIKQEDDFKVKKNEDDDTDTIEDNLDDYQKIRDDNIQRNYQFLASIGIQDVKSDLQQSHETSSRRGVGIRPVSRGLSTKRKSPSRKILPPRRSGRVTIERLKKEIDDSVAIGGADAALLEQKRGELEGMIAEKAASTYDASASIVDNYDKIRQSEPVTLLTPLNQPKNTNPDDNDLQMLEWGTGLLSLLDTACAQTSRSARKETDCEEYRASVSSLQAVESDVAKVVPQRITAMVMHPSETRTLVIAGDKQGHVGFWNADEDNSGLIGGKARVGGEDGVYLYQPHVGNISSLCVLPQAPGQVWSTSYDGTVRRTDIERQAFIESFQAPGEYNDVSFHDADFSLPGAAYLGCNTGDIVMLDTNSGSAGWTARAHEGKINSVQIHPSHAHLLVTASSGMNGFIAVHDMRKVSSGSAWKPLFTLNRHSKSINAAYLSPGSGEYLVSVSLDNTVKVWKDILTHSHTPVVTTFNRDNFTGRWLSTLKPSFDPNATHSSFCSFLLGSMVKPRRIEVYTLPSQLSGSPAVDAVINLAGDFVASVCSRNCFHPSRKNILAGGNSSGKVHLFR
jgi:WD40 repeat protein